jgi:hypothetical protein
MGSGLRRIEGLLALPHYPASTVFDNSRKGPGRLRRRAGAFSPSQEHGPHQARKRAIAALKSKTERAYTTPLALRLPLAIAKYNRHPLAQLMALQWVVFLTSPSHNSILRPAPFALLWRYP